MGRINISQAANQAGVSRRTLERWIREGRLSAIPDPQDGRKRLVDPEVVQFLVQQIPERRRTRRMISCDDAPSPSDGQASVEVRNRQAIDKVLLQVYRMHRLLLSRLDSIPRDEIPLEALRDGPFGRDLQYLAAYAQGQVIEDSRRVRSVIESALEILFWPTAMDDYTVPREFWDTDLGKLLSRAKLRAYMPSDLIRIHDAARLLGVSTPTIYRWMDDRTLGWVRNDHQGRTWVVRRDIDQLKRKAAEISAQPVMSDQALAS